MPRFKFRVAAKHVTHVTVKDKANLHAGVKALSILLTCEQTPLRRVNILGLRLSLTLRVSKTDVNLPRRPTSSFHAPLIHSLGFLNSKLELPAKNKQAFATALA